MRKRIEKAYTRGGGNRSGLEPVMKQIIKELERIETLASPSPLKQAQPAPSVALKALEEHVLADFTHLTEHQSLAGPYLVQRIKERFASFALSAQVQDVAAKSLAGTYQKYLDASDIYNERLAISKTKATGTMRVDEEYRAIDEARRAFDKLAVDIAKSALPAAPAKQEG